MMIELNAKLHRGWNPFIEEAAPKAFHKLCDILQTYIHVQEKELEQNSLRSYRSFIKALKALLIKCGLNEQMYVYQFDKNVASDMMMRIRQDPKVSPKTFNNYLQFYKTMFNWFKAYNYVAINPFENLQKVSKKYTKTTRTLISVQMRAQLKEYLSTKNKGYLAACMLCYYCFLRPNEISWLRVGDVDFKRQTIKVRAEHAKNDHDSFRTIPDVMMPYLLDLNLDQVDPNDFLFSNYGVKRFSPGKNHVDARVFAKYWEKLRDVFHWESEVKFYNLKHTGITDMLAMGVAPNFVQGQADHHSLAMTSIYAATVTPAAQEQIRTMSMKF